jgi:hypothetical protein
VTTLPPVAQTAPQLYCQLAPLGMADPDLARIRAACLLGARVTSGLVRGSGKPFACHLVGVASLVAESLPGDADVIVAALLHAMYQERVPFGVDRDARQARLLVAAGATVEALVARYEESGPLEATMRAVELDDPEARIVRVMQLADEIEDALDGGPWWHGSAAEGPDIRGSAEHRATRFLAYGPCYAQAPEIGAPALLARWEAIRDAWAAGHWPVAFRSGERTTFAADQG